jgi:uncharacterized protein YbcI
MSVSRSARPGGELAAEISNLVVKLVSEYTGRGPTKSRTFLNEDLVTIVLEDTLTKGERSLVDDGKSDLVLSMRLAFQQTMREAFIDGIEEITGRKVRAFLSANHMEPDIAIESFILEPVDSASQNGQQAGSDVTRVPQAS